MKGPKGSQAAGADGAAAPAVERKPLVLPCGHRFCEPCISRRVLLALTSVHVALVHLCFPVTVLSMQCAWKTCRWHCSDRLDHPCQPSARNTAWAPCRCRTLSQSTPQRSLHEASPPERCPASDRAGGSTPTSAAPCAGSRWTGTTTSSRRPGATTAAGSRRPTTRAARRRSVQKMKAVAHPAQLNESGQKRTRSDRPGQSREG